MARGNLVPDGLAVRGDQIGSDTRLANGERRGVGERFAEEDVDFTHLVDAALLGTEECMDALAQRFVDLGRDVAQQAHLERLVFRSYVNHSSVDPVD